MGILHDSNVFLSLPVGTVAFGMLNILNAANGPCRTVIPRVFAGLSQRVDGAYQSPMPHQTFCDYEHSDPCVRSLYRVRSPLRRLRRKKACANSGNIDASR